jgi:hypothetical protein
MPPKRRKTAILAKAATAITTDTPALSRKRAASQSEIEKSNVSKVQYPDN